LFSEAAQFLSATCSCYRCDELH